MLKTESFCFLNQTERMFNRYIQKRFSVLYPRESLKRVCLVLAFVCSLVGAAQAMAFGIGSAHVNSYIGEPLNVSIPIFNIEDPDALAVALVSSSMVDRVGEIGQIDIHLSRDNNQLSIVVSTNWLVNEPYLNFELEVSDLSNTASKKFTVLLNLRGARPQLEDTRSRPSAARSLSIPQISRSSSGERSSNTLGPYEWAESGSIPARFGAVINGQSLWRVARRINKAMDVSIDQMMLALYLKNPSAFSTSSVDSLKVGSFLDIPSRDFVIEYTEREAIDALKNLSGSVANSDSKRRNIDNEQVRDSANAPPSMMVSQDSGSAVDENSRSAVEGSQDLAEGSLISAEGSPEFAEGSPEFAEGSPVSLSDEAGTEYDEYMLDPAISDGSIDETVPFRTSNLDQTGANDGAVSSSAESQEIISSLATTVGNLTQELIRKDKRIEYLEERIEAIQEFSGVDADQVLQGERNRANVASVNSSSADNPNYYWLLPLLALALFFFLFRDRLAVLWHELNLFGKNDRVHFEETVVEVESDADIAISKADFSADKEISILAAVQQKMKKEHIDEVSFLDLEDVPDTDKEVLDSQDEDLNTDAEFDIRDSAIVIDELGHGGSWSNEEDEDLDANGEHISTKESEHVIEFESSAAVEDDRVLSFDERFDKLLQEEDFAFAEELLEFAKNNEIEEDRYHYERLRLLLEMEDRDGFYDYYYTIESEIPDFDEELSNGIAVMISVLGR